MASRPVQEERRVALQGLPSARLQTQVTPQMYGAQIGSTVEDLGLAVYSKEIREANQTAFMAADRKLSEAQTELQVRLGEMRGRDAMGAPDALKSEWDKIIETIGKDAIYNDVQRQAFERSASARFDQTNRWLQGHVSQEKYKFQENETVGYLKASQDSAALNSDNPRWVAEEKNKQQAALQEWAVRNGFGSWVDEPVAKLDGTQPQAPQVIPESEGLAGIPNTELSSVDNYGRVGTPDEYAEREDQLNALPKTVRIFRGTATYHEKVAEVHSGTNKAVVERLLNTGKDLTAKKYYDANKAGFTVGDRAQVERVLEEGSYRGEAMRQTREIVSTAADLKEALEPVKKIDDPKLAELVRAQVTQHYNDQAHATKMRQDSLYEAAGNAIDQAVVNAKKKGSTSLIARNFVKPAEWAQMSLGEKAALQNYADQSLKPDAEGKVKTDDAKYLEFLYMSPQDRAKLSLRDYHTQYRQYFSPSDQAKADTDLQRAREAKENPAGKEFHVTDTQSFTDQVKDTFATSGLVDPNKSRAKYSDEEVTMEAKFQRSATAAIEAEERAKGKKLTPTERQAVIDQVKDKATKEMWVPGRFWGTNKKPAIMMTEDDKARAVVPLDKIPEADLQTLKNYMTSLGKTPTNDKLRRAYAQYIQGNRAALDRIINEP